MQTTGGCKAVSPSRRFISFRVSKRLALRRSRTADLLRLELFLMLRNLALDLSVPPCLSRKEKKMLIGVKMMMHSSSWSWMNSRWLA